MIKALQKEGMEGTYLDIINQAIYNKPIANIILNSETQKVFPLRLETRKRCPLSPLLFNTVFGSPSHNNQTRRRNKKNQNYWKGRTKAVTVCR